MLYIPRWKRIQYAFIDILEDGYIFSKRFNLKTFSSSGLDWSVSGDLSSGGADGNMTLSFQDYAGLSLDRLRFKVILYLPLFSDSNLVIIVQRPHTWRSFICSYRKCETGCMHWRWSRWARATIAFFRESWHWLHPQVGKTGRKQTCGAIRRRRGEWALCPRRCIVFSPIVPCGRRVSV